MHREGLATGDQQQGVQAEVIRDSIDLHAGKDFDGEGKV